MSWEDYRHILGIRGERSAPRITLIEGVLELMTPSKSHERLHSDLGRLIEVWMDERGLDYQSLGSWTLESQPDEKATEPDGCWVIGAGAEAAGQLDGPEPERPDLVLEVEWTHAGLNKLALYAARGVPEVWWWKRGTVAIHVLRDGEYVVTEVSEVLPGIDLDQLLSFLEVPPTSAAKRAYQAALRR